MLPDSIELGTLHLKLEKKGELAALSKIARLEYGVE